MKKVDQNFLKEQVRLMLSESAGSKASDGQKLLDKCRTSDELGDPDLLELAQSILVGGSDAFRIVAKDIVDRAAWGKSSSALKQKAAYVFNLNKQESYLFRLLDVGMANPNKISIKRNEEYFNNIKKLLLKYSKSLSLYKTSIKSKRGSKNIQKLVQSFIKEVLEVNKEYGLTDEKPSWFIENYGELLGLGWLRDIVQRGRYLPPTDYWISEEIKKFKMFLEKNPTEDAISSKLEKIAVQISNLGLEFDSYNDVITYIRKETDLVQFAETLAYYKSLKNAKVFWAYFDIINSTITSIFSFGVVSAVAKAGKLGQAEKVLKLGVPVVQTKLINVLKQTNKAVSNRIKNKTVDFLTKGLREGIFTAPQIIIKTSGFAIPLLVSVRISMEPVLEQLPTLTIRHEKLINQYFNVIENKKINTDLLPGNELVDLFKTLASKPPSNKASNKQTTKTQSSNSKERILSDKEAEKIKTELRKELEEVIDRMSEAIYTDYGDIFRLCGGDRTVKYKIEDEIKQALIEDLRGDRPDKKMHTDFSKQSRNYLERLQEMHKLYKKNIQNLTKAKTAALKEIEDIKQQIKNTKIENLPQNFGKQKENNDSINVQENPNSPNEWPSIDPKVMKAATTAAKASKTTTSTTSLSSQTQGKLEQKIYNISKVENLEDFAKLYSDIFSTAIGLTLRGGNNAYQAKRLINNSNLRSFTENKIKYLKILHKSNIRTWYKEYQKDLKAAGTDPNKILEAEKKIAFFHRPMYYVSLVGARLTNFFGLTQYQFGFEPNIKRVNVAKHVSNTFTFYKDHGKDNKTFNEFLENLKLLNEALKNTKLGLDKLEAQFSGNVSFYEDLNNILENMIEVTEKAYSVLKDDSEPAVRRAYQIYVLDIMLAAF